MKRTFPVLFLFAFAFSAPADCPDNPCQGNITNIGECPDEGCRKSLPDPDHPYDPELNKQKNIRSDNQQSLLRSIKWIKALPDPTNTTECGSREELKQLGEGQKVTVVAWALTARKGSKEKCNCELGDEPNTDNHIVLVDRNVKEPTLEKDEDRSVTAEFTPLVRLNHPNFTQAMLNHLIDPNWKKGQNNANGKLLVRVTGLLMYDSAHFFGDPLPRATNWEIHPILKFEYCSKGKSCRVNNDNGWVDFDTL